MGTGPCMKVQLAAIRQEAERNSLPRAVGIKSRDKNSGQEKRTWTRTSPRLGKKEREKRNWQGKERSKRRKRKVKVSQ